MRQVILDTETTGINALEGHRIIEIGCVEMINRKLTGAHYHQYINPERDIDQGALEVHGITREFLRDKPVFKEIINDFMTFISGAELIIHNAPFDVGFLDHELQLAKKQWKKISDSCRIIDTLPLARQLHVGQRNSLDALCKRYFIDNSRREFHGALLDAHLLAQVYLAMTGGQSSLFDEIQSHQVTAEVEQEVVLPLYQAKNLSVVKASAEELALHEKKLEKMRAKGKCLWVE